MPESPSLLLQRAADALERLAEHFAVYREEQERSSEFPSAAARWIHLNVGTASHLPANEWMWTMTPAVAAPLVAWLRYTQVQYEVAERRVQTYRGSVDNWTSESDRAALEFARLVLGISVEEETTQ